MGPVKSPQAGYLMKYKASGIINYVKRQMTTTTAAKPKLTKVKKMKFKNKRKKGDTNVQPKADILEVQPDLEVEPDLEENGNRIDYFLPVLCALAFFMLVFIGLKKFL